MREPKVAKGEPPQQPICVLNIVLPEITTKVEVQKKLKGKICRICSNVGTRDPVQKGFIPQKVEKRDFY